MENGNKLTVTQKIQTLPPTLNAKIGSLSTSAFMVAANAHLTLPVTRLNAINVQLGTIPTQPKMEALTVPDLIHLLPHSKQLFASFQLPVEVELVHLPQMQV